MKVRIRNHGFALAIAALVMTGCSGNGTDSTTTEARDGTPTSENDQSATSTVGTDPTVEEPMQVTLLMASGGIGQPQFPIAEELGYYEQENLDVTRELTDGSSQAMQLLVAGQGDIATVSTEAFLTGASVSGDVVAVYRSVGGGDVPVFGMIVREDASIQDVGALDGGTVGVTGLEGGEVPVVNVMLQDAGLVFGEDTEVVPVGDQPASIVEALDSGDIDAFGGSVSDFSALAGIDYPFRYLKSPNFDDFPIGGVIAVRRDFLEANPGAVAAFVRTYAKAVHVWTQVPEIAAAATQIAFPESWENPEGAQAILNLLAPLYIPRDVNEYGRLNIDGFAAYIQLLQSAPPVGEPIIQGDIDIDAAFSNDLIADINDWDRSDAEAAAQAYLDAG